jgi:ABC-2 type transport system permease protein
MIIGVVGFNVVPSFLAGYREKGILRRLHATPADPAMLPAAQLAVGAGAALASVALVLGLGRAAFGVALPARPGWFALVVVLATAALLAVGLVIAALAPSGRAASVIGAIAFQPSLFLAGVWVPREALPAGLQRASDFTPLGAALQAVRDTWTGAAPRPLHLGILAAYTLVAALVAARLFRWE